MRQCVTCKKPLAENDAGLCKSCLYRERLGNAMTMVRAWSFNLQMSQVCDDQEMIIKCEKELAEAKEHFKQVQREGAA